MTASPLFPIKNSAGTTPALFLRSESPALGLRADPAEDLDHVVQ